MKMKTMRFNPYVLLSAIDVIWYLQLNRLSEHRMSIQDDVKFYKV